MGKQRILFVFFTRFLLVIPSFFTDPYDFAERWLKVSYYDPPLWSFWLLLIITVIVATFLTYKELKRGFTYHRMAWKVYDNLVREFRELTYAKIEVDRANIHARIEKERGKLPDERLDEMITLFLAAEAERARFGMNTLSDDAQYLLSLNNKRMRNHINKKYGGRDYGEPKKL